MYLMGWTNYTNHEEAKRDFEKVKGPAALTLSDNGRATVSVLSRTPVQHGQKEFVNYTTLKE